MIDRDDIDVINMSIGFPHTTPDLDAVLSQLAKTKILIAAAGKYKYYKKVNATGSGTLSYL